MSLYYQIILKNQITEALKTIHGTCKQKSVDKMNFGPCFSFFTLLTIHSVSF